MKKVANEWNAERVRKYPGLENLSDVEAENAIASIRKLAHILVSIYKTKPNSFFTNLDRKKKLAA